MNNLYRITVLVALTAGIVFAQDFEEVNTRTWTSGSGKKIEAELISYKYGSVTLRSPEGKLFKIPISALSSADREYVKKSQSPASDQSTGAPEPAAAKGESVAAKDVKSLPTLSNGSWTKMWDGRRRLKDGKGSTAQSHAIYRHAKFEARVGQQGNLYILPIKDGKPLDSTLTIRHHVWRQAHDLEGQRVSAATKEKMKGQGIKGLPDGVEIHRKLIKFTDFPEPGENPSSITLKGMYEDDIPWECTYEFKDDTITYYGSVKQHSSLEYPALCIFTCALAPSHEFDHKTTIDEQRSQTAHCSISVVGVENRDKVYDYTSSYNIYHPFKSEEVKGHFAPYTIRFDAVDADNHPATRCYPGVALYNGSSVWSTQDYDDSSGRYKRRDRTPKVRITIK